MSQWNLNYLGARPRYYLIKAQGWINQEEHKNRPTRKRDMDQRGSQQKPEKSRQYVWRWLKDYKIV